MILPVFEAPASGAAESYLLAVARVCGKWDWPCTVLAWLVASAFAMLAALALALRAGYVSQ